MKIPAAMMIALTLMSACTSPQDDQSDIAETDSTADVEVTERDVDVQSENGDVEIETVEADDANIRSADSHVHGGATLSLVLEEGRITAELETPLQNILGFEHEPETGEQWDAVEAAEQSLKQPATLMKFNTAAECVASAFDGELHLFDGEHHDHDKDHDDEHEDHDDEENSDHRDVIVTYSFDCGTPDKITSVSVDMLKTFPLMTELDVIYLGPNSQSSFELSPANITTKLRP